MIEAGGLRRRAARLCPETFWSIEAGMLIVHVQVHVKAECIEDFKSATRTNARLSLLEPGVLRFDVLQQADDPTRFVLAEIYRDAAANAAHKETAHYPVWRDKVADMMAEPRSSTKFEQVFPA
jgi:autoinducer 2-degrading protein